MKRAAMILVLLLMSMNFMLWVNGEFTDDEITNMYPMLPAGLSTMGDVNQEQLTLTNSDGNAISTEGQSFATTTLTFLESIPVLGFLITLFLNVIQMLLNLTFGITFVAMKWNLPMNYITFIGAVNFGVVMFGLLEFALDFTGKRGGTS